MLKEVRHRFDLQGQSYVLTVRVPKLKETGSIRGSHQWHQARFEATELNKRMDAWERENKAALKAAAGEESDTVKREISIEQAMLHEAPEADYHVWQEWRDFPGLAAIPFVQSLTEGGSDVFGGPEDTREGLETQLRFLTVLTTVGLCMMAGTMEGLHNDTEEAEAEGDSGGAAPAPGASEVGELV